MIPAIVTAVLTVTMLASCHFTRAILFLRPDIKDFKRFPARTVSEDVQNTYEWVYHQDQLNPSEFRIELKNGDTLGMDEILKESRTNAFIVVRNDTVLFEQYYHGYSAEKKHTSFSVSKGMLASLLGIALEEGWIKSLEDPITTYLPELRRNDPLFDSIQLGHLLEMTSGIMVRKKEASLFGDLARTYYGNNWSRFMKTIEIEHPVGEVFEYKQTDTQLLTLIIRKVSGKSIAELFSERIWSRIGTQEEAYWNYYKKDGIERGYCCFTALPMDFARFARLYLKNGVMHNETLVPKEWMELTVERQFPVNREEYFTFHRHWFLSGSGKEITAQGFNGQIIYINPEKNLLILRFGSRRWKPVDLEDWIVALANEL